MTRIECNLKPSKRIFLLFFILHVLAGVAVCASNVSIILQMFIICLLIISVYEACWKIALQKSAKSIVKCDYCHGQWLLYDRRGFKYEAELRGELLVTSMIIIINFHIVSQSKRVSLIICNDSLDREFLRKLRVLLLHS